MSAHVHASDEELLERVLAWGAAERDACAECTSRSAELARDAARTRAVLVAAPRLYGELAARVLARTTRSATAAAHPGRARAVRWIAAILLVQVLSLPVLGWLAWREVARRHAFQVRIEETREALPPDPLEPERTPELTEPEFLAVPPALSGPSAPFASALERDNALALARYDLARFAARAPTPSGPPWTRAGRLLAERRGALPPAELERASSDPLEEALRAEALLDRYVLRGERTGELDLVLARLSAATAQPEESLALLALERAHSYGLIAVPGRSARTRPMEPRWWAALATAARARGWSDDPEVRAWLAAGAAFELR